MTESQRPLNLGEVLDRTVQLYRRNFLQLVGICALPSGVMVLIVGGVAALFATQSFAPLARGGAAQAQTSAMLLGMAAVVGVFILLPLVLAVYTFCLSAANQAVLRAHQGEKATIRDAFRYALKHFWRHLLLFFLQILFAAIIPGCVTAGVVVVASIVMTLLARGGAGDGWAALLGFLSILLVIAFAVVSILIWLRYCLGFSASVAEELPAWPSMKRSNKLTQGSRGRIFVMFLLVGILTFVVSLALTIPVDILVAIFLRKGFANGQMPSAYLFTVQAINLAVDFLVRSLVTPIYVIALMLFYFDQRTRQEGYDIEQLMAQAGGFNLVAVPLYAPAHTVAATEPPVWAPGIAPLRPAPAGSAPAEPSAYSEPASAPLSHPPVHATEITPQAGATAGPNPGLPGLPMSDGEESGA